MIEKLMLEKCRQVDALYAKRITSVDETKF